MNSPMKTGLITITAALICSAAFVSRAAEPIGSVISVKGSCSATAQDGASRKLDLKSPIFLNDKVATEAGSSLQIMLDDNSVLSQGEKSALVIDSYVYKPKTGNVGCSIKAVRGLFRMVTGKITDLNPERFKVKTRMATVGIRGCEVGFKLEAKREDIYILYLPPGKSILIERNALAGEMVTEARTDMDQILTIVRQGVVVSIEEGGGLQKRDMTTEEIMELMSSVFEITEAVDESTRDKYQDDHAAGLLPEAQLDQGGGKGTPHTSPPGVALVANGGAPFTQWAWGLYADGSVFYDGNAVLGSTFLSPAEYAALITPTSGYNLTGSFSESQAQVYHAASGETKLFTSPVPFGFTFNVNVAGGGVDPTWGGTFNLSNPDNPNDNLSFVVDSAGGGGTIGYDGHFRLNQFQSYQLNINGRRFDLGSVTAHSWDGQLLTDGSRPVTGAAGEYHIEHGQAARVDGAWGTDLN